MGLDRISLRMWLFAALPLVLLLVGLLKLRWSAPRAGALAWIAAMVVGAFVFGGSPFGLGLANAKGTSLTLFVVTIILARGIAPIAGKLFPLASPYIGVLGCFMTGSNTNSNVLFGAFQVETALALGVSTRIMAAVQSAGGSLGSAIAPAKVLIGSTTVGLSGREDLVMRKAIPYCLLLVLVLGVIAWLSLYILFPQVL